MPCENPKENPWQLESLKPIQIANIDLEGSGRRMFLVGTTLSAISLFLPWYVGQSIIPVFFDLPGFAGATASGVATGGWIEFAITGIVPWVFMISRQAMPIRAIAERSPSDATTGVCRKWPPAE